MKIGIDCRTILNPAFGERAGVGHYTYYLLKSLLALDKKNIYVLFFDSRFKGAGEFEQDNVLIRFFPFYQYKKYLPVAYSQMLISAVLNREKLDVFHSPANVIPLFYNRPSVLTVHDLAIYKYPKFFPAKFLNRQTFSTQVLVPRSLRKACQIIAVSKNTKTDIIEEFGIPEEKILVVYEGVESYEKKKECGGVMEKYGISGKYILFLGTIEPRKNIASLIKAFRNLRLVYDSPAKECQLVIAGSSGWNDAGVYEAISDANAAISGVGKRRSGRERRSGVDTRSEGLKKKSGERRRGLERRVATPIKHIGYVPHEEKICLLSDATAFVFPSLYEGFGLPVLEAMSLGVPTISSDQSSLPEITGEQGAILVNPNKESEIVDALAQILTDEGLRESLSINGRKKAQEFTWEKCAQETLDVYRSVGKAG